MPQRLTKRRYYDERPLTESAVEATFPPKFKPFISEKARWKVVFGGRGSAKLLALDTPLPTPQGWTTMGDVQVGDMVIDEQGKPTKVIIKSPVQYDKTYRITFSDDSTIVAGASHQWVTWTHSARKSLLRSPYDDVSRFPENWPQWRRFANPGRWGNNAHFTSTGPQIYTTQEIKDTLTHSSRRDLNHCIPQTQPLQLPSIVLPIQPYTLGLWLGDGSSYNGGISSHQADMPYVRREIEAEGYTTTDSLCPQRFGVLGLPLRVNNLITNKHIPPIYLRASVEQRLSLLQGLMDSDGTVDKCHTSFTNTVQALADGVYELVVSLGMRATRDFQLPKGQRVNGEPYAVAYRVYFTPTMPVFRLPRKLSRLTFGGSQSLRRHHRMIKSVEEIDAVPMQCISVASPNSMYLCGKQMVPTHNTESIAKALLLMGQQRPLRVLCAREIMQSLRESSHQVLSSLIGLLGLEHFYTIENARIYGPWIDSIDFETGQKKKRRTEFFFIGLREMNVAQIKSYFDIQIIWIDEASEISKKSLRLLGPTLRRAQGSDPDAPNELWVSFNPTREHDAIYEFIKNPPEDSIIIEMNWRDNPWFEKSGLKTEMEHDRKRSYEEYLHTWEGQCLKYWEGQILLEQLKQADVEGRLTSVPYLSEYPVEVAFDIGGGGDATAYWVYQKVGDFVHMIDYHEKRQSDLDYHLHWLESKPYVITKYWLPQDAKQKHAGMVMSYEQLVRSKGKKVQIIPSGSGALEEGINALRTLFPRLRFDKAKCARGIECLRNYRYELEADSKGGFKQKPVHDQYSHGADAARYVAMAYHHKAETTHPISKYNNTKPFLNRQDAWMAI